LSRTRTRRRIRRSVRCTGMYPPGSATTEHRFARIAPKSHVNSCSEPTTLGYGLLEPDGTTNRRQRCFWPTHAFHVFKDEHPGCAWLSARFEQLPADGLMGPWFTPLVPLQPISLTLDGAVDAHHLPGIPTSDARVARQRPWPSNQVCRRANAASTLAP
jgi:hypothetical protein